ncbi:OLC1v1028473C1 [Oldenlandia corymbosa var. corymbosa]|uniref:OLC1v1028473C1 n=1 Tax=Oldenlandia corymbosa var. corymbosa TaxID=529605 RepID=A0AAV1CCJ0_OLDCO|nr:OLC1v1028473C1 [Oldenlandia corymbosa var. corymbosa]
MGDAGVSAYPGNLDPRAREFIPVFHQQQIHVEIQTLVPPNMYYSYPQHHFPTPSPPLFPTSPAYVGANPSSYSPPPSRGLTSRALLLSMVPTEASESLVRRELEVFGDVRAVQMERIREGIVTVHFYDLRQAQEALVEIQAQHMQQQYRLRRHYDAVLAAHHHHHHHALMFHSAPPPQHQQPPQLLPPPPPVPPPARGLIAGRAVWAQYTVPVTSSIPEGTNQGTLVVFNLDPEVSPFMLTQIFQAFGHVKELRETPRRKHQRFVEFFDTRDAARALMHMNGKEIHGRQIVIEFSRPGGGYNKNKSLSKSTANLKLNCATGNHTPPSPAPVPPPPPQPLQRRTSGRWLPISDSFDDKKDGFHHSQGGNPNGRNDEFSRSSSNSSRSSLTNSMGSFRLGDGHEERSSSKFRLWSPSGSKKSCKGNGTSTTHGSGGSSSNNSSTKQHQLLHKQRSKGGNRPYKGSSRQSKEYDPRFLINEDSVIEADSRDTRTTVMIKNIPNKYSQKLLLNMLDNHCIHCNEQIGGDGDDRPLSSYDFVYLPIDFVNKCNVGYGFVNMTTPEATLRLYKAFHRQSWEVFNSRKICEVTYARLQGVEALKEHFKNSKFPYDIDEYMPVIFSPPRDGRLMTEPVTISGRSDTASSSNVQYSSCTSSSPGGSSNSKEDHFYYSDELSGHLDFCNDVDGDGVVDGGDPVDGNHDVHRSGGGSRCCSSSSNGGVSGGYDDSDDVE